MLNMKTLKEKRQELNKIIDNLEFAEMNNFENRLKLINTIKFLIKEQEEEFIKEILDWLSKNSLDKAVTIQNRELYIRSKDAIKIIKDKSGFDK